MGAGDFDLVFRAIEHPYDAAKSIGIELRKDLTNIAEEIVRKKGLENRVKVIQGCILSTGINISDADLVYVFLSEEGNARIRNKLQKQLRDEARVVSYDFFIPGWSPYSDCKVVRAPIVIGGVPTPPTPNYFYLYRMSDVRKFQKI